MTQHQADLVEAAKADLLSLGPDPDGRRLHGWHKRHRRVLVRAGMGDLEVFHLLFQLERVVYPLS